MRARRQPLTEGSVTSCDHAHTADGLDDKACSRGVDAVAVAPREHRAQRLLARSIEAAVWRSITHGRRCARHYQLLNEVRAPPPRRVRDDRHAALKASVVALRSGVACRQFFSRFKSISASVRTPKAFKSL